MIGCKGLTVMATRGAKEAYGHCDDNGIFKCNKSFTYNWTYHIYFGRTDFEIRKNDSTNEIHYKISKQHSGLIREFGEGTYESFYAAILRAAVVYYYDNIDGLSRPPFKSELKDRIYIKAKLSSSKSYGVYYGVIDRPYIEIFRDESSEICENRPKYMQRLLMK